VLFEPATDDYLMFDTNIFSFAERRAVAEHAYHTTRQHLLGQYEALAPIFARHGLVLSREVLEDTGRDLWEGVGLGRGRPALGAGREPSGAVLVRRLDEALRQLERLVEQRQG
jgi:hypothetical protein